MLRQRSWRLGGFVVVNQLTSDTTPVNLYARTGKFLVLYEGTGRRCTSYWSEFALGEHLSSRCERRRLALFVRFARCTNTKGLISQVWFVGSGVEGLASNLRLLLGWI